MLRVTRYGNSHYWAIWDGPDLVAVVVYKKGAAELLRRLQAQEQQAPAAAAAGDATRTPARQPPARP